MNHNINIAQTLSDLSAGEIILIVVGALVYMIGLYLHSKIILVSKKEKDLTWKLDITHSSLVIFHFTHTLFMHSITNIVPHMHEYLGVGFCYTSKVITDYVGRYISGHSLMISILKYTLIVHWEKVEDYGKEKVKTIFFWMNILHPIIMMTIHLILRPDHYVVWDAFSQVDRCLGDPKNNWGQGNGNRSQMKLHSLCIAIPEPPLDNYFEYAMYLLRSSVCWIQIIVHYLILWNIIELFVYGKTFWFMRR